MRAFKRISSFEKPKPTIVYESSFKKTETLKMLIRCDYSYQHIYNRSNLAYIIIFF